jgi:hypothetical protein
VHIKGKGGVVPVLAMKAYIGEFLLHSFLTLTPGGSEWWTSESGMFTQGKGPRYEVKSGQYEPQNRPKRFGEKKNPLALPVSCVTVGHCSVSL